MAENPEIFHNFDPKYVSLGAEEPAAEFFILRRVLFFILSKKVFLIGGQSPPLFYIHYEELFSLVEGGLHDGH